MRWKLLPLFFVLLAFSLALPSVHALSQYVGYSNTGQTAPTCGANCQFVVANYGIGETVKAPFGGSLVSVGVWAATGSPGNIVILTTAIVTPASITYSCSPGTGTCAAISTAQQFTVADREPVTLTSNSFNTLLLGSPVTVTNGQWVAIVFTACGGVNCLITNSGPGQSTTLDTCFSFGTNTPANGANFNTVGIRDGGDVNCNGTNAVIIGGTFQQSVTPISGVTQCYGNCGTPPVTLANTNSTHLTNYNASITQFYPAQSNLNGFVLNVTVPVARSYTNTNGLTIGLYTVDPSCTGSPFTTTCPGFLQVSQSFTNPSKGNVVLKTHIQVANGEWIGVSVSGTFTGLDLNDTNANVHLLQISGRTPSVISTYVDLGNRLTSIYAWINGNFASSSGPGGGTFTGGGGCFTCGLSDFVGALGGGVFGGIIAFGIIFGIVAFGSMYATRIHHPKSEGGGIKGYAVPMELLTIFAVLILIGFSAAGVLPPWIPFLIIALVAWLFTQAIWGHRRGTATSPM